MFLTLLTALLVTTNVKGFTGIQRDGSSVYSVAKHSPAAAAGIKVNDKILKIDGADKGELIGPAGVNVELDVQRGDELLHFSVPRVPHEEAYR